MRIGGSVLLLGTLLASLALCGGNAPGQGGAGRFYLVDYRTQMPVMCGTVAPNWLAGGKTVWTSEPSLPVTWYVWFMSPDQRTKLTFNSQLIMPWMGRMRQAPVLNDPKRLPGQLLQGLARDYGVPDLRLVDARFEPQQASPELLRSRQMQAQQRGIRLTGYHFTELVARYEGTRNGEKRTVKLFISMLALESQVSRSFTTMIELLFPMSFGCPAGEEEAAQAALKRTVGSFQFNPNFTAMVNQISNQRTANWLATQNQIREQQLAAAASTSATLDRVRDKWSEYIRDVDPVVNPNTGEKMLVDSRYDHAWINSENEIIYHNNGFNTPHSSTATFDPNSDVLFNRTSWRQLK